MSNQEKEQYLREKYGDKLLSISRLNSYNTCPQQYYQQYIMHNKSEPKVYGILGSLVHDIMEKRYLGEMNLYQAIEEFAIGFNKGICQADFPSNKWSSSEEIGIKWWRNVLHFIQNHKVSKRTTRTEEICFYKTPSGLPIRGYIDLIIDDKSLVILDWKTSSKFTGDDLVKAGRQLVLYAKSYEQETGKKVDGVCWNMMKYCKATNNKTGRENIVERRFCDDTHTFVKDHILQYKVSDELVDELHEYIDGTVKAFTTDTEFKCMEDNDFFCHNLCGYKGTCPKFGGGKNEL